MFVRVCYVVLRYTLVDRKIFVSRRKYCSSTMVKSAPLPTEDTSAAEAVACGFGAVHGDEVEVAADVYELV